jgi:3'-5' exonuclease
MMSYAIFDIETRIDKRLLADAVFRGEGLSESEAYERMRRELIEKNGNDFFPLSFHVPISIAIGFVATDYGLQSIDSLPTGTYDEEALAREFWERVERFPGCLVSFNGRQFDLPVLELQALRYGCPAPRYFGDQSAHRHRYRRDKHYDLYDFITNAGMYRVRGGFDLLSRMMGFPAKGEIDGSMVQGLWEEGRLEEIHRYCRRDVLQTYRLLLRVEVVRGRIEKERAEALVRAADEKFGGELEG